ncbi:putative oxidoreductase [Hordeum vulgare]|nr:putative oxidoreductase [Hordeum vulgare]
MPSNTVETEGEEDETASWTLSEIFPAMQQPPVHECESSRLVREWVSTSNSTVRAALDMFDEMSQQDRAAVAATLYHETEKTPFAFSHCWLLLDAKPKWQQVVADLKVGHKRNDGSSSHQSIGLDDDDDDVVATKGKAIVPQDNRLLMGTKWEKARISRDAVATKMSSTWAGNFFGKGEQEIGEVQAYVGCVKREDGAGSNEGGEVPWN